MRNRYQSLTAQIMAAAILILQRENEHKQTAARDKWLDTYDYIVVGSGSAGTPVAYRLTEDPGVSVLLVEAGGRQSVVTDIPENYLMNLNTEFDWGYTNEPQQTKVGLAFKNQRIPQNRGKVLGGSSTLNAIIFNRGNARDYDNWAEKYGAKGWSYKDVLYYFKKYEKNNDPELVAKYPEYHSQDGPVQVMSWDKPEPIIVYHQRAVNQLGFKNVDVNGPEQVGHSIMQTFQRTDGKRSSTANSYLDPNPHKNLHILTNAFVTQILLSESKKGLIAEGIEFFKGDKKHRVKARKEVIVSAGAINSPQLLMLSGIGPKEHLKELRIPVKLDLPVGDNLQDHPSMSLQTMVADEDSVNTGAHLNINQLHQFFKNATGPLTEFYHSIVYFNTKYNDDTKWPDVSYETIVQRFPNTLDVPLINEFDDQKAWAKYFAPYVDKYYLNFQPILEKVKSYGKLRLKSSNPYDYPLIDPNFLAHPIDYKAFHDATKFMIKVIEKSSFSKYVVPLQAIPGCRQAVCPRRSFSECDPYIECLIRQLTRTGYHPMGTARMGAIERDDVVVDPRLKVKGSLNLRVCDASIMPEMINANTNAASIMIGEKCADLVKEDNKYSRGPNVKSELPSGGYPSEDKPDYPSDSDDESDQKPSGYPDKKPNGGYTRVKYRYTGY